MPRLPEASTPLAKPSGAVALRALAAVLRHFGEAREPGTNASAGSPATPRRETNSLVPRDGTARTLVGRATVRARAPSGRPDSVGLTPSRFAASVGVGWDGTVALAPEQPPLAATSPACGGAEPDADGREALVQRIIAGHVPGRGLQVVGSGVGSDAGASNKLVALARTLAGKGRSIVVDLNTTPFKLAPLCAEESGRAIVRSLDGLSELLAGEASFAAVIHRDHATRLHFIPTGRKEADFRDFDLVMDALTQTYDFIVLLTPIFPHSEIAKVMAPYADFVVLSTADESDAALVHLLRHEMAAAGAREILVFDRAEAPGGSVKGVA